MIEFDDETTATIRPVSKCVQCCAQVDTAAYLRNEYLCDRCVDAEQHPCRTRTGEDIEGAPV